VRLHLPARKWPTLAGIVLIAVVVIASATLVRAYEAASNDDQRSRLLDLRAALKARGMDFGQAEVAAVVTA